MLDCYSSIARSINQHHAMPVGFNFNVSDPRLGKGWSLTSALGTVAPNLE
jgi:hypothetical protein